MLIVLSFFFDSCKEKTEHINPVVESITESVYASGFIKSKDQYQVYPKASGVIKKWLVKEGDPVQKGQLLCVLSHEISRLNQDNAQLVARNADLQANMDKLRELNLAVETNKKKMDNDKLVLDRQRSLWSEQIGTKFEFEQRELAYSSSKSAYESARLRYNELKKQLNFSSEQSRKNLSISKAQLDDYYVKSEFAGKMYSILREQGEMVSPQIPVAVIGDASSFSVFLNVDENDIVHVSVGQKVFITMDSYKGQLFEANVLKVFPLMDERSRSFQVEASFVKPPPTLYPFLTLEANIVLQSKDDVLTIPRKYLINDTSVLVGKKQVRNVKVGLKDYQKAEILEGLTKEDKIYMPE